MASLTGFVFSCDPARNLVAEDRMDRILARGAAHVYLLSWLLVFFIAQILFFEFVAHVMLCTSTNCEIRRLKPLVAD